MNREIEFRLRSPLNKIVGYEKWYAGSLDSKNFWTAHPCWLYSKDRKCWNPKLIEHRFKDQATGLRDKDGDMIFEGSIVRRCSGTKEQEKEIHVFKFDTNNGINACYSPHYVLANKCKILGSAYENPELLKGEPHG